MRCGFKLLAAVALLLFTHILAGCADRTPQERPKNIRFIVTSDTILSTMTVLLVPSSSFSVTAIMPPDQCPGHYDMKLSDIEKTRRADLIISVKGMSFMDRVPGPQHGRHLVIDAAGRNFMAPDSYVYGLNMLTDRLTEYFPEDKDAIVRRKKEAVDSIKMCTGSLLRRFRDARFSGQNIIAASMQKETLEWMGFRVVGEYGRPEAMSVAQMMHLVRTGKERHAIFVADNLQSGPDAGRGIAESLGISHVVLTNFPSEKGYCETLKQNVEAVLTALKARGAGRLKEVRP